MSKKQVNNKKAKYNGWQATQTEFPMAHKPTNEAFAIGKGDATEDFWRETQRRKRPSCFLCAQIPCLCPFYLLWMEEKPPCTKDSKKQSYQCRG